jgi:hypothetical protein
MDGREYYDSLIQQGYSPEQAEQYTTQHYPGFTAQKQTAVIQDSVVAGNLHSGDVIHHHHHAAPVVQAAPVKATVLVSPQSTAQPALIPQPKKKVHVVPWIGVVLIFMMLFMPFVQLSFEGENFGDSMSGFEIIGEMAESSDDVGDGEGVDDAFDLDEIPQEFLLFGIAILMLMFSPFVYLTFAGISAGLLIFKKNTLFFGILHLSFFGIFMICSLLGTIDELGVSISAHSNMAGWGFFGAGLSGILLCIRA